MKINKFLKIPNQGFSLIELLLVIAIVAILASLAAPSFSDLLRVNRLSAASSALQVSLSLARSEAVRRGGDARVSVVPALTTGAWNNGWAVFWHSSAIPTDPAPTTTTVGSIELIEIAAAPSNPVSVSYTSAFTSFTYGGNGRLMDPAVANGLGSSAANRSTWFFDGVSDRFCVIVNRSGRARTARVSNATACPND